MSELPHCSKCGTPLPADAPAGLCPKCLVQAGFESEVAQQPAASGGDPAVQPTLKSPPAAGSGFEPPSPKELAPLFPQLEILELLGKGGMGAVYKARQRGLDRLVAVKILPPEIGHDAAFAERFTREARALARLNHPHIVAVYDFGQSPSPPSNAARGEFDDPSPQGSEGDSGSPLSHLGSGAGGEGSLFYIVMEYVDGVNLRQTIQTGTLTPDKALAIVPQICEALQFAHDEGIVHRDIKPENILIDKRGRVKIADFGLAKLVGQDPRDHFLTGTHQVMGTLRYMAPEQMQGSREVDHRADIYSLGVVFYELLTGELPMGRFAPPSKKVQVDVRLDEVVLRALEQDPEQRYQHASQIKTDVESVTGSPAAPPASPAAPAYERGDELLLDEIDRSARTLQHSALIGGLSFLALGILLVPLSPPFIPLAVILGVGSVGLFVVAGRTKQQWEVEYCGHSVRFENSVFTSGCLLIDGKIVATGGIGLRTELRGRIPRGPGAGDRIVVMTWAGFLSFRCQILVQPQMPASMIGENTPVVSPAAAIAGREIATEPATAGGRRLGSTYVWALLLSFLGVASGLLPWGEIIWYGTVPGTDDPGAASHWTTHVYFGFQSWQGQASIVIFLSLALVRLASGRSGPTRFWQPLLLLAGGLTVLLLCYLVMKTGRHPYPMLANLLRTDPHIALIVPAALAVGLLIVAMIELRVAWPERNAPAEQRRIHDASNAPPQIPAIAGQPRFSRYAIAGAVWALFGLLAVILAVIGQSIITLDPVANATALPADVPPAQPSLAFKICMGLLLAMGAGAPFGTTIFGAISIGHIKRSGGKIIGLPLAVADALFFPLGVLDFLIMAAVAGIVMAILFAAYPDGPRGNLSFFLPQLLTLIIALPLAVWIDFLIVRSVWRNVAGQPAQPPGAESWPGRIAIFCSLLFFGTALLVFNWVSTPFAEMAATVPVQSTIERTESHSKGPPATESSSGWIMGPSGPVLTDAFAQWVLKLRPDQIAPFNAALQDAHRDYLALEQQNTACETNAAGHVITMITPFSGSLAKLEDQLWSRLDAILNSEQQSVARLNLRLHPKPVQPPMALSEIVAPGFFGWGEQPVRVELWRVGKWYHWKVDVRGYGDSSRAPQLPEPYRRFWKEPTTDDARIVGTTERRRREGPIDVNGVWDSGSGPVEFTHEPVPEGAAAWPVSATYYSKTATIDGTLDLATRTIEGKFHESKFGFRGRIRLVISQDGQTIHGTYGFQDTEPIDTHAWNMTRQKPSGVAVPEEMRSSPPADKDRK